MTTNRITFGHDIDVDYWNNRQPSLNVLPFKQHRDKYYPIIKRIREILSDNFCNDSWFFFEPYVEITWVYPDFVDPKDVLSKIKRYLKRRNITDYKIGDNIKGHNYGDWFCNSEKEKEFGCKVHVLCAEFVKLYYDYKDSVDNGKTLEKQISRTIHRLCNPLGLNFWDEAKICFRRGIICSVYTIFFEQPKISKFILEKIFRFK